MRLGRLEVEAGHMRVKRFGVVLPDGLHVWIGNRGVHLFWSSSPYQRRVTFDYDPRTLPRGDFDRELYCRCGACVDRYVSRVSGDPLYDYADPDTGEQTDGCPQCEASIASVAFDDAVARRAER